MIKKSFFIGIISVLLVTVISIVASSLELFFKITGGIGLITIALAVITSGGLVGGDRMRANFHTETKQSRTERLRHITIALCFALPNLIACFAAYLLMD